MPASWVPLPGMRFRGDGDAVGAPHTELPAGPGLPIPYINTVLSQCCANGETEAQREVPVQGHKAGRGQARIQDSGSSGGSCAEQMSRLSCLWMRPGLRGTQGLWVYCLPQSPSRPTGLSASPGVPPTSRGSWPPGSLLPRGALGLPRGPSHLAGLRWLTGVLPKDCVAHELEKALGIEAGAVDRHRILEESWGCPGAEGASTNSWRQPWTDAVCVRGAPSV